MVRSGGRNVGKNIAMVRAMVFEMADWRCEWPSGKDLPWPSDVCGHYAVELAHIHSRGMGGSKFRDTVANCFAACQLHARVSDHLAPQGGRDTLSKEWAKIDGGSDAFYRIELLAQMVRDSRARRGYDVLEVSPADK